MNITHNQNRYTTYEFRHKAYKELKKLQNIVHFGFKHNDVFKSIPNINIIMNVYGQYNVFYTDKENNKKNTVSSLITKTKNYGVWWLDHLYFKDKKGKEYKFKTWIKKNIKEGLI